MPKITLYCTHASKKRVVTKIRAVVVELQHFLERTVQRVRGRVQAEVAVNWEKDRFVPLPRLGTNADAIVHPLRSLNSVCAVAASCVQRTHQDARTDATVRSQTDDALESSWS